MATDMQHNTIFDSIQPIKQPGPVHVAFWYKGSLGAEAPAGLKGARAPELRKLLFITEQSVTTAIFV